MLDPRVDQAAGLRKLFQPPRVRVLPVIGGESCAGRILQFARALSAQGEHVLVLDESAGEVVSSAGVDPHGSLGDLIRGRIEFDAVAPSISGSARVMLVADGYDALAAAGLTTSHLYSTFATIPARISTVLVYATRLLRRTPAQDRMTEREIPGESDCEGALALLVTPNSAGIATAYQQLKRVSTRRRGIHLLIDGARSEPDGLQTYQRIAATAERFLGVVPRLAGCLPPESSPRTRRADSVLERLAAELGDWALAEYRGAPESTHRSNPKHYA